MKLTIVAPLYNESSNIDEFCRRCLEVLNQIGGDGKVLIVNDGSTDDSLGKIKSWHQIDQRINYLSFTRNFGHQQAITAGLNHVEEGNVVILDSDLQDPPELIPEMLKKAQEGFSIVVGQRKNRKGESWFKLTTAKLFYRLMAKLTSFEIPLDAGDFRLIDQKALKAFNQLEEQDRFIRGIFAWTGFKTAYLVYDRDERKQGATKFKLGKMIRFAIDGITSFSDFPLKMATFLGFFFAIISFFVIIYALISKYVWHDYIQGWTSLILTVTFIGSIQLITVGLIGEYISRIHHNTRKRPIYIVEEKSD